MGKVAFKAEAQYRDEMLVFQKKHPEYILVIKDAESVVRYRGQTILNMRKDYSFLNGLIKKRKGCYSWKEPECHTPRGLESCGFRGHYDFAVGNGRVGAELSSQKFGERFFQVG